MKSGSIAFLLWLCGLFGLCGLHRFYVGKPITGAIWFLTLGLLGIGQILDLFFLGSMVSTANMRLMLAMGGNRNINTVSPTINVTVHAASPSGRASEA